MTIDGDPTQFIARGYDLQLTCRYNASPPVSNVSWKINGTQVIARNASVDSDDSRITIPHYNESQIQLRINATTSQDAGNYTCDVTNDMGPSSATTVIVIGGVFKCTELRPPHTSRFLVGRQKNFTCRLVCGEFRQVCDKIGAFRAISDSARSQKVLSGLVS